jgi:hypothetical protein
MPFPFIFLFTPFSILPNFHMVLKKVIPVIRMFDEVKPGVCLGWPGTPHRLGASVSGDVPLYMQISLGENSLAVQ